MHSHSELGVKRVKMIYILAIMFTIGIIAEFVVGCLPPSGCGGSGEDLLPGLRGCGCGRGVCYCVQSRDSLSN